MVAPMIPEHFPRDLFYCYLDGQPDYLIPPRLFRQRAGRGPLIINPRCRFGWHREAASDLNTRVQTVDGFFNTPWIVWVEDLVTSALAPFWLGPELAHVLVDLAPGQTVRVLPRNELLDILWNAQIVVTPDYEEHRRHEWTTSSRRYATEFRRGYVAMDNVLHPFHVGALRRYFRHQTRTGKYTLGDGQVSGRYFTHTDPVAAFFHRQLTGMIADVAGLPIRPSYSYVSIYQGGADLPPHTDRDQCEYTLSLCFDATPEPSVQVPWPLCIKTFDGPLSVLQHLGDGFLFRGRQLTHWRDALPANHTVSTILFHYVDRSFPGPDK
jgi:hypothetical protein